MVTKKIGFPRLPWQPSSLKIFFCSNQKTNIYESFLKELDEIDKNYSSKNVTTKKNKLGKYAAR